METLNVLYQHDNNYAVFGGVSIFSLLENNRDAEDLCIYQIDMGLTDSYKEQYCSLAKKYGRRIVFLPAKTMENRIKQIGMPKYRGSYATYMKLFAIALLPPSVKRIFYLDSDLLVEDNLSPLMNLDMQGNAIAMVRDGLSMENKDIYGFSPAEPYFCGGTILFDTQKWQEQHCLESIVSYTKTHRSAFFAADQDILNIVFKHKITTLDIRYDFTYIHTIYPDKVYLSRYKGFAYYSVQEIQDARQHVAVLHFMRFLGESPWNLNTLHPHRDRFDYYLSLSPWREYQRQPAQKSALFLIERFLYRLLPVSAFLSVFMLAYHRYVVYADKMLQKETEENIAF